MSSLNSNTHFIEPSQFTVFPSRILKIEALYYGTDVSRREYQQVT